MADRSIVVRLRAEVDGFKSAMAEATKATERVGKGTEDAAKKADTGLGRMVQSAQKNRAAWDQVGGTLTAFGAASVGALGLATKAAMDWESSWAGVQKTVEGTAPQMAELEDGLRGMARELPASHAEIAAVAEAAGQLGIETPNILGFTRTMVDMGVATNMSSEEAATSLARFMNVMGTSQTDVDRLGATVVGLGNNFATTESEIVAMSQRLSGAGAQAGLTEGDVMGMAAAMSSVGIEAEAGGSAMSQTMKRIGKAVDEGGDSLDLFAQVSGMTAEQFSKAWNDNPAMALDGFINGLSGVEEQGMTTNGVLAELGITGIRESDSLLRLSAAADSGADGMSLLATAVQQGNDEFSKGSALIEEASKRYETAESKIAMAKNALVDAGISIGGVVLPAFADLAGRVADVAGWFADLPAPVHGAVGALGGIAGAGALAAGGFLLLFPRIMDSVQGFKTLKKDFPGVASGLGKVGAAAAVAAAGIAALNVVSSVTESFREGAAEAELFAASLLNASANGGITADSINELAASTVPFGVSVQGVGDALDLLDIDPVSAGIEGLTKSILGVPTTADVAAESLSAVDGALTSLISNGNLDEFSTSFQEAASDAEAYGHSAEDLMATMPGLQAALTPIATEMGLQADNATLAQLALEGLDPAAVEAAAGMGEAGEAAGEMAAGVEDGTEAVEEQVDALAELQDLLQGTSDLLLGVRGSARSFEEAMDAASAAVEENGKTLDITTEAGRANEAALDGIASSTQAWANEAEAAGASAEELDGIMRSGRDAFIESATAMGMSGDEATALADELQLIPSFVDVEIAVETQSAIDAATSVGETLGSFFSEPYTADIDADTGDAIQKTYGFEEVINGATADKSVNVGANVEPASNEVNRLALAVNSAGGTITVNGNTVPADSALDTLMGIINNSDGTVTIDGKTYPADQALNAAIDHINSSGGTVDIDGNASGARSATSGAVGHANSSSGTIDVNANAAAANSAINNAARNRTSTITVFKSIKTSASATIARAAGGPVFGPGTGTSDSIPALLSNGEHVITAAEVARAGGQDAIYRMRAAINSGLKFANGGGVEGGGYASAPVIRTPVMRPSSSDGVGVAQAVSAAMSGWQPIVNIDGREFSGLMMQGNRRIKSMGGR